MNTLCCLDPRAALLRRATLLFLFDMLVLFLVASLLGVGVSACTKSQVATAQTVAVNVPQPSVDVSATIRTRVAATVKNLVKAHPATAPWCNGLAQACYEISGVTLPSPLVMNALFGAVEAGATLAGVSEISVVAAGVEAIYTADYPLATSVQGASKNYLTLLGEGIQDGVKAAAVPAAVAVSYVEPPCEPSSITSLR